MSQRPSFSQTQSISDLRLFIALALKVIARQQIYANGDIDENDDVGGEREADRAPNDLLRVGQDDRKTEGGDNEEAG